MEVKASAKFAKIGPQKTRLVADLIRGLRVSEAREQLSFMPQKAAQLILKLLNSAIANAVNNFKLTEGSLSVKTITVGEGPRAYRWMPKAFGRATPLRRKTAHIDLILESTETAKVSGDHKTKSKAELREQVKHEVEPEKVMAGAPNANIDSKEPEKLDVHAVGRHRKSQKIDRQNAKNKGFIKKLFNRKAV